MFNIYSTAYNYQNMKNSEVYYKKQDKFSLVLLVDSYDNIDDIEKIVDKFIACITKQLDCGVNSVERAISQVDLDYGKSMKSLSQTNCVFLASDGKSTSFAVAGDVGMYSVSKDKLRQEHGGSILNEYGFSYGEINVDCDNYRLLLCSNVTKYELSDTQMQLDYCLCSNISEWVRNIARRILVNKYIDVSSYCIAVIENQ